jgi:cytosine/adenosine deaminase-related metal-dependent hydrolase
MEGRLLLKDCAVFRPDGRYRTGMAIVVEGAKIARVARDDEVLVLPGDWAVSCRGRLVAPGLTDCHAHLVTGQLVPLAGEFLLRNPQARLEAQRRIESQLTAAEVEALTAFGIARALRSGVTFLIEHLHCPGDVRGGLAVQGRVAASLGTRLVNSHATTSWFGAAAAFEQLDANAAIVEGQKSDPLVRCALGFHASFSCEDDLLKRLGHLRSELQVGIHCHLAETEEDLNATFSSFGQRIVPRLESFGLLGPGCIAAHARCIDRSEVERLVKTRTAIAISPFWESITEPSGGGLETLLADQSLLALGTSGSASLRDELFAAFSAAVRLSRVGRLLDPDGLMAHLLFSTPSELCSLIFDQPSGNIEEGNLADLVVYDCVPSVEPSSDLAPQLLLQLGQAPVAWVIVGGRVVIREGRSLSHDYLELAAEADRVLSKLWSGAGLEMTEAPSRS